MTGDEVFIAAVEAQFAFLVSELGFRACGLLEGPEADPREASILMRYFNDTRTVDVVSSMTGGLAIRVGKLAGPVERENCRELVTHPIVDFETLLVARYLSALDAPFPEMKPHKVFMTLYRQQVFKYTKVVSPRLGAAVAILAARFKTYGQELVSGDLDAIYRETQT